MLEAVTSRIIFMAQGQIIASGCLAEVRGLLKNHPQKLLITSSAPRKLGSRLLESGLVTGVVFNQQAAGVHEEDIVLRVSQVDRFYRELPDLVMELGITIERLIPLDSSAEAVFGYLLGNETEGHE